MRDSLAGSLNSKTLKTENSKLTQENRKLVQEINELRNLNRKMETRWETTEKDLKGVKKDLKLVINEKDNNYTKLEEEYIRVQGQLETLLKKSSSSHILSPTAILHSKGLSSSTRRTQIENLFSDESLLSGAEEQYPIWAATLKKSDGRTKKSREELQTSENVESYFLDKNKPLLRRIDELEEERSKLRLENTKLELSIKQKEKEKNLFIEKLIACETKLESSEEEIRMLQSSLKNSEASQRLNDNSLSRLKSKIDDLETENLRLVEQRNELQIQADRAQREARLAKGELEYELKHATRSNLNSQEEHRLKNEINCLNNKIGGLESQLRESKTKVEELENSKTQAQNSIASRKELEELEKLNEKIRQDRDQIKLELEKSSTLGEAYEKRIQELEAQITKYYKTEIKESQKKDEELRLSETELEAVKKQLQAAQLQNEALEARALITEDENKRLRENVGEGIGDEERMISNIKILEFERMEMLQNYKKVCFENEKIKTELAEILIAHKECLRELRDTKTEADALKAEITQPEKGDEEYFNQVAIFEELNQKLVAAESLAEEHKQAKEKVHEELIAIREEKQKFESSGIEIQQTLSTLQRENGSLKEELAKIKADHEILREEFDKKAINNEVLKGLLEDQKKNQWKSNSIQVDRRLESQESFLSASLGQESKRKGISSDKIMQFYSPQGKSDVMKWEQGYKDQLRGVPKFERKNYESKLVFGAQEDKNYWSQDLGRGIKQETRSLWDSGYLKTEGDDSRKKKYGSVSLANDKKFTKF